MDRLKDQMEDYLHAVLGICVSITPWVGNDRLPLFLREHYHILAGRIMDQSCLFLVDREADEKAPAIIGKHIGLLQSKSQEAVIYVRERITAYHRKRLVEHRISFLVPGTQMYLPYVGIDFREHFRRPRNKATALRPCSQAVLIYALLENANRMGPTAIAARLGYTVMSASRAFDELEAAGIIIPSVSGRGKERLLCLAAPKRDIWAKAQLLLRSPVKTSHVILWKGDRALPGSLSGLSALACYSMLAEPEAKTVALCRDDWNVLLKQGTAHRVLPGEPDALTVEVWRYAPGILAAEGRVDRLSLYLSLRDTEDERIQDALESTLEGVP